MNRHEQSDDEWSNDEKSGRRVYEFAKIRVLIRSINFYGGFLVGIISEQRSSALFVAKIPAHRYSDIWHFMPASFLNWRDKLNG